MSLQGPKQYSNNNFMGFLYFEVDNKFIPYPFNVQSYSLTTLSLEGDAGLLDGIKSGDWLFGVDENNYDVAFQCNNTVHPISFQSTCEKHCFSVPIIVKSDHNGSYEDLKFFDGLLFEGGALNYLYSPTKAYWYDRESNSIQFRVEDQYRRSFDVILKDNVTKVVLSIDTRNAKANDLRSNSLGDVNSYIEFYFDKPQPIEDMVYYQDLIQNFVSFCVGQNNTGIETQMLKKDERGEILPFASCRFNYANNDMIKTDLMSVLRLDALDDMNLLSLLQLFDDDKKAPYIEFLPSNDQESHFIRPVNIQMLCTALEREYLKHSLKLDKDEKLDSFKKKLLDCVSQAKCEIKGLDEKYIESAKDNVNRMGLPSEKSRITIFYERYREHMLPICEKYIGGLKCGEPLNKVYTLEEFTAAITQFVKLRNDITHKGIFDWKDRANIYAHLYLIFCFSVMERAGIQPVDASKGLSFLFGKRF